VVRHEGLFSNPLILFAVKIATLLAPLGGPHLVMDTLRPLIGKSAAAIIACAPVVLMYIGADALADPSRGRWRKSFIRLGFDGAILLTAMNTYAIWRIFVWGDVSVEGLMIAGLVIGSLSIVVYTVLAHRALRVARPPLYGRTLQDFGGPIE
jgi:hypothetical protein